MHCLNQEGLQEYRSWTYRLTPDRRVTSPKKALDFINERGFIYFWPISGVELPSLWAAVAGNRPVAEGHDDPGHITWGWKDDALDKHLWYYAKVLRRKATFISLEITPYFYALSENYGSPEEDHILAYKEGHLTLAAKQIYDALLEKGSLNTIDLRKEAHLQNAKESTFTRALEDLQKDFKILPVGVTEAGAWHYSYRYELTSRHFPELPELARPISEADARRKLMELYFCSVGAAQTRDLVRLFNWPVELVKRTLDKLIEDKKLVEVTDPHQPGEFFVLPELL
jgi:DNA glycosylase AlkZ-like